MLPGNGGTRLMGGKVENVNIRMENYDEVLSFATREAVGMACIGPEQPIADGLWDKFAAQGIPCVGPSSSASILESSKAWSKDFMVRNGIPTARHRTFKDTNKAINYLKSIDYEVVVKVFIFSISSVIPTTFTGIWFSWRKRCNYPSQQ